MLGRVKPVYIGAHSDGRLSHRRAIRPEPIPDSPWCDGSAVIQLDVADGENRCMLMRGGRLGQRIPLLRNPVHMMRAIAERVRLGAATQEAGIGRHARELGVRQRLGQQVNRRVAVFSVHDQFRDHGIIVGWYAITRLETGIPADRFPINGLQQAEFQDQPRAGAEAIGRVFGADARLDGMAHQRDLVLRQRNFLAGSDQQLPGDKVLPGNHLGHRMLHLKPGIHFEEPKRVDAQRL